MILNPFDAYRYDTFTDISTWQFRYEFFSFIVKLAVFIDSNKNGPTADDIQGLSEELKIEMENFALDNLTLGKTPLTFYNYGEPEPHGSLTDETTLRVPSNDLNNPPKETPPEF